MDFSKHISKDHKHSPIIQHVFDFSETGLASEEVESLTNCDQVVFFLFCYLVDALFE